MATPLQVSINAAAATGVAVALSRPVTQLKITNTATSNSAYISLRNVNNGDSVTAPGGDPAPTAGTPSSYLFLGAGKEIEIDMLKNSGTSDYPAYTASKVTHILIYSTSGAIINIVGTN